MKRTRRMITLQFIPYHEIESLDSEKRISKIMRAVRLDKILLIEGRLKSEEEADLIKKTMEEIGASFKGIELSVIDTSKKDAGFFRKLKIGLVSALLGTKTGLTIIGPASIVKEIKQDPDKIQLLTAEVEHKRH